MSAVTIIRSPGWEVGKESWKWNRGENSGKCSGTKPPQCTEKTEFNDEIPFTSTRPADTRQVPSFLFIYTLLISNVPYSCLLLTHIQLTCQHIKSGWVPYFFGQKHSLNKWLLVIRASHCPSPPAHELPRKGYPNGEGNLIWIAL